MLDYNIKSRFIKKLIINLLIFIFMLAAIELIGIEIYRRMHNTWCPDEKLNFAGVIKKEYKEFKHLIKEEYYSDAEFRKEEKRTGNKTIITAGCSFTFGEHLKDDETFSYKLAEYTNYNVLNIGLSGASPREALYILRNMPAHKKNVDFVIFTYINDHKARILAKLHRISPAFLKIKENGTERLKYSRIKTFFENISRVKYIIRRNFAYRRDPDKSFDLFCLYMKEINREIKKKFSQNTKLVVIFYQDFDNDYNKEAAKELEKEGIEIISLFDLLGIDVNTPEYQLEEKDHHPNAKAWDIIVPALARHLKLNSKP